MLRYVEAYSDVTDFLSAAQLVSLKSALDDLRGRHDELLAVASDDDLVRTLAEWCVLVDDYRAFCAGIGKAAYIYLSLFSLFCI